MSPSHTPRRLAALFLSASAALAVTGCGSDEDSAAAVDLESAADDQQLGDVCPETLVVQLQWQPQTDMAGVIGLLGPGWTVDEESGAATGPLVTGGRDTGIDIELRPGGPAIGFEPVTSQMYADDDIALGIVHGDQLVTAAAGGQPVLAVTPLLKYSPSILMWDPESHPDWSGIEDIGGSGATVVASDDQTFPAWLVANGLLDESQLDFGYEGTPDRFVSDPSIAQQGFASSEPYVYENEVAPWHKPVEWQLLKDVGYDIYASNVTVRTDRVEELSPCLERVVPMIQQATADFAASPDAVNQTVVDWVGQDDSFFPYSEGEADYAARTLVDEGLVAAEDDGAVGTYDIDRAARTIDELEPIVAEQRGADVQDFPVEDLYTNQFTDPSIGL
jgi:hypothetical protein